MKKKTLSTSKKRSSSNSGKHFDDLNGFIKKDSYRHIRDNLIKARTLSEALPFIQTFHGKLIVVKLGGATLEVNIKERLLLFIQDIVLLKTIGIHPVLIHGGGQQISLFLERLGKKSHFIEGLRVTDSETMDITQMVLAGLINKNLVSLISQKGGRAVGLSGKDGNIASGKQIKKKHLTFGQVGEIEKINPELILNLIDSGYIPVIAPIASNPNGLSLNVNADTFASEIALSLKAEKLIFISDVPGVLQDVNKPESLYNTLKLKEIDKLIKKKIVGYGMVPKLLAAKKALKNGVNKVHFISERINHSLLVELLTEEGIGTLIYKN